MPYLNPLLYKKNMENPEGPEEWEQPGSDDVLARVPGSSAGVTQHWQQVIVSTLWSKDCAQDHADGLILRL